MERVECSPGKTSYKDSSWVMCMQTTIYMQTDTDVRICGPKYSWKDF